MRLDFLKDKKILITGGTGSIGSELVFKLIKSKCKVIRIMSNDENGLYELSRKINSSFTINYNLFYNAMGKNRIRFFLGDVRDKKRCIEVTKNVDIVVHAAALKHVNISQYNPNEAMQTNFNGTKNMINASVKNKVSKFIYISTDKVVYPTSIMGKSKLLGEKFVINSQKKFKKTKFASIRFGNVIGSRGSVVPNFINLLERNKNISVTNKNMARFVMTIDQAVNSILKTINKMSGGEIFILKSMKCFKILDLAFSLVDYYKKKRRINKKITITKENKGEKLEEELFSKEEAPLIKFNDGMFIIKKTKKSKKNIARFNKYRISNFNFMKKEEIIKILKKNKNLEF